MQSRADVLQVALDGILVQRMMDRGAELLTSAFRDPDFGVMVSLGAGGTLTEVIDDVVLVPAPLGPAAAARALSRLRVMRKTGKPSEALVDFVWRFSASAVAAPWRRFVLEVNPAVMLPLTTGPLIVADQDVTRAGKSGPSR